jgi:hypothetical protein
MKKILLFPFLLLFSLIVLQSNAQKTIIFVTDDAVNSQMYADDLASLGHTIVIKTDLNVEPSPDQINELNAADLIIIPRTTNSANYNFPAIWNNIETPILLQSCFLTRNTRLAWFNMAEVNEADGVDVTVIEASHPIFKDIDVSSGNLLINTTAPLHTNPVTDAGNGKILAVSATSGNIVIAEWPKGTQFFEGSEYSATEYRGLLLTGISYDFTPEAKLLYLNFVNYILNPGASVSVNEAVKDDLKVYPLPAEDAIKVSGSFSANAQFEIVTLNGQVLTRSKLTDNNQINISGLNSGVYVLKISSNNQLLTRKFVKK